jgi:hypothetical protein
MSPSKLRDPTNEPFDCGTGCVQQHGLQDVAGSSSRAATPSPNSRNGSGPDVVPNRVSSSKERVPSAELRIRRASDLELREGDIEQDGPPGRLLLREGYFRDMMLAGEAAAG